MAKRKKKASPKRSTGGAKLGKRCPKPGVMVRTRAGLIGVTTGTCAARRVKVALMGAGERVFTRGELKKVPKGQQERIKKELARADRPERRNKVIYVNGKKRAVTEEEMRRYGEAALRMRAAREGMAPNRYGAELSRRFAPPATAQDRFFDGY